MGRAPRAARRWAWLLALLVGPTLARGGLELEAEPRASGTSVLDLAASNTGPEPVAEVTPEVVFAHRTVTGQPVSLAPGERRTWVLPLVAPPGPGVFPASVRARYRDGRARSRTAVLVVPVVPAATSVGPVEAELLVRPIAGSGGAELVLQNPTGRTIAGRVALLTPGDLNASPESQPAEIPAHARTQVPFVLQDTGVPSEEVSPIFAIFEYDLDGAHRTSIARTEVTVVAGGSGRRRTPLLIGLAALALSLALLALAWRRTSGPAPDR